MYALVTHGLNNGGSLHNLPALWALTQCTLMLESNRGVVTSIKRLHGLQCCLLVEVFTMAYGLFPMFVNGIFIIILTIKVNHFVL